MLGREIVPVDEPGAGQATAAPTQGIDQPTSLRLNNYLLASTVSNSIS
jgi:hypothetical protein